MSLLFAFVFFGFFCAGRGSIYSEGDYAFNFSAIGVTDYARVTGMISLNKFTVCFWMKSSDQLGTVFSYTEKTGTNDLLIIARRDDFRLDINHEHHRYPKVSATDGNWHLICVIWSNTSGRWRMYKDGEVADHGMGFQPGYTIQGGGSLVLGQDQESYGGGFESRQSFQGELANLNVWSYILSTKEINSMSHSCLRGEGDVYKWADFKHNSTGNVEIIVPSPCPSYESSG